MQLQHTKRTLSGWPSIFLDGIRFLAAFAVLVTHCRAVWFPERELDTLPSNLSHGAVVIFFVLSGFVIAHTTSSNNRSAKEYAIARLSRLYSVFIPAMVITAICALFIWATAPEIYEQYKQNNIIVRYLISIFFCNELWFFSSAPLINGPIWSLSYEFWYYAIFGAFFYKKGGTKGYMIPALICLIAGPKILLLMLMWLVGWLVYHLPKPNINNSLSWLGIAILFIIAIYLMVFLPSIPNDINTTRLHWADKFISDFIVSLLIGAIFYILPNGKKKISVSIFNSIFKKLADLTFPIYVLHFPLLVLSKSLLSHILTDRIALFQISLATVFMACSIIGIILEGGRVYWKNLFNYLFSRVQILTHKPIVP